MSTNCLLSDRRRVTLATEVVDRLTCGVIVLEGVDPGAGDGLTDAIAARGDELRRAHAGREPSRIPALAEARTLYKSFGTDPSRHRPSSEALLRRVLQGKGLYRISNVVDTCNLASLTYLLPIGMYDLAKIEGDIVLRTGRDGEEYAGIRKGPVHLAGRLGLFDASGPFGSPTSDSARTCTDGETRTLLSVIMATASYDTAKMTEHLAHFRDLFARHCGTREVQRVVLQEDAAGRSPA